MKFHTLSICVILVLCFGCQSEPKTEAVTAVQEAPKEEKMTVIREPIEIYPSVERDYPEDLVALGFPIHPKTAVHNVGSTRIMEEGLLMQLNTYATEEEVVSYYQEEMAKFGWIESKLKIYKGANQALKFDKDGLTCKFIIINEEDQNYRKIAVNVTKALDISNYQ